MRFRLGLLAAGIGVLLAGCSGNTSSPSDQDSINLVPDFAASIASSVDPGGIGGVNLPDDLALTTEQKAAIAALHQAFMAANAGDVAALQALEAQARAANRQGRAAKRFTRSWRKEPPSWRACSRPSRPSRPPSGRSTRRSSAPGSGRISPSPAGPRARPS